ncbi:MAG: HK97 family phage prohead protease, partial [Acidobacteriota bacterium]
MPPRTNPDLSRRALSLRAPSSLNAESRSLRAVISAEQPVDIFDYERWERVPEVLLADGMQAPANGQVSLLDTHARETVKNVLGSARDFKVVDVSGLRGVEAAVSFASTPDAMEAFTKLAEGHLTDFSVGYKVLQRVWVERNTTATVNGRTYAGPVSVVTSWSLRELSAAPIGADDLAKARAHIHRQGGEHMNMKLRKMLEA